MCVVGEHLILTPVIGAEDFVNLRMIYGEVKIISQQILFGNISKYTLSLHSLQEDDKKAGFYEVGYLQESTPTIHPYYRKPGRHQR